MKMTSLIAGLLLAVALTCSCQTQSDTEVSPTSSYKASQLTSAQSAEGQPQAGDVRTDSEAVVISTRANLRETPDTSALVILKLEKGGALSVLEEKPVRAWYKVRHVSSGKTGWIHGNTIRITVANPSAIAEQSARGSGSLPPATPKREKGATAGGGGDTYINSFGEEVPRPRRSASVPAGASARCRDGTYSFSRNRRGTCSHHGGVAQWL